MLDKMKELWALKKQMEDVKRELDAAVFEVESSCRTVKLAMNGSQELQGISIQAELSTLNKAQLEKALKEAYAKAIKRSHELAAHKMKSVSGLNMPGLR